MKNVIEPGMVALGVGIFLLGCADARFHKGSDLSEAPGSTIIHGVPTITQTSEYSCGYACLASVALYYDVPINTVEQGILEGARGEQAASAGDLVRIAESFGLAAFGYEGSFDDLKSNLQKSRPVLALLPSPPKVANYPGLEWAAETGAGLGAGPHWVVVLGVGNNEEIIIHDPRKGLLEMSRATFSRQWDKQSRMAVLVGKRS